MPDNRVVDILQKKIKEMIGRMRDVPYILGFMLLFVAAIVLGGRWYGSDIREDTAVTNLNTILRTTAIEQVSPVSRIDTGMVYLNQEGVANMNDTTPDFETSILFQISETIAPKVGSKVRFDYILTDSQDVVATQYVYTDSNVWQNDVSNIVTPGSRALEYREGVEAVRVRYRLDGQSSNHDNPTNKNYWTYQSTIEVARSEAIQDMLESQQSDVGEQP